METCPPLYSVIWHIAFFFTYAMTWNFTSGLLRFLAVNFLDGHSYHLFESFRALRAIDIMISNLYDHDPVLAMGACVAARTII